MTTEFRLQFTFLIESGTIKRTLSPYYSLSTEFLYICCNLKYLI